MLNTLIGFFYLIHPFNKPWKVGFYCRHTGKNYLYCSQREKGEDNSDVSSKEKHIKLVTVS